jgi:hypothetical protein
LFLYALLEIPVVCDRIRALPIFGLQPRKKDELPRLPPQAKLFPQPKATQSGPVRLPTISDDAAVEPAVTFGGEALFGEEDRVPPLAPAFSAPDLVVPRQQVPPAPSVSSASTIKISVVPGRQTFRCPGGEFRHPLYNPPTPPRTPDRINYPWKYKDPYGPQDPRALPKRKFPPLKARKRVEPPPYEAAPFSISRPNPDPVCVVLADEHLGLTYFDVSGGLQKVKLSKGH